MGLKLKSRLLIVMLTVITVLTCLVCGCDNNSNKALSDGNYKADITMEGGTGKATILSPVDITVTDNKAYATLVWSSSNYDYMIVDNEKYINESSNGGSTFTVPVPNPLEKITVIGDTTAMSVPHEIEYTITFDLIK